MAHAWYRSKAKCLVPLRLQTAPQHPLTLSINDQTDSGFHMAHVIYGLSFGSCQKSLKKSGPLAFTLQRFDLALCATAPCPKTTSQVVALVSDMSGKFAHIEQTHGLCSSCNIKSPLSNSVTCYYAVWRISCRTC